MEDLLTDIYYEPNTGYISAKNLYIKAKERNKKITQKYVKEWLNDQEVYQIHKQDTRKKNYLPIFSNTSKSFQIDLAFLPKFKSVNKQYSIMLTAVDINTRLGYAYKMKKKTDIYEVMEQFISDAKPKTITSDNGSEFINKRVRELFEKNDIEYYTVQAGDKSKVGKIERFNRTIKERLNKYFTHREKPVWYDVLDEVIDNYNDTIHSSIGQTPNSVNAKDEQRIINEEMMKTQAILNTRNTRTGLQVGDYVRIPLKNKLFDKGEPKFSNAVYIVQEINNQGNSVKVGGRKDNYKFEDLQLVINPKEQQPTQAVRKKVEKEYKVNRKLKTDGIDRGNVTREKRIIKKPEKLDL